MAAVFLITKVHLLWLEDVHDNAVIVGVQLLSKNVTHCTDKSRSKFNDTFIGKTG